MMKRAKNMKLSKGFSLIEFMVASVVILVVVMGGLALYRESNRISVDQQNFAELQHDVRSGMFFISRDVRSAGVGLPLEFVGYFMEGEDNEDQGEEVRPDRLIVMGNMEDPLNVTIENYQGSAANAAIIDYSFEQYPYPDSFYENKVVIVLPNPASGCMAGELREITHVSHSAGGNNEKFNFSHGLSKDYDPPGGLSGTCPHSNDYDGGTIAFVDVKEYWLDVTGNYPGLTAGENGYIGGGVGNVLYLTHNGVHKPLAQNVENLQFEYNGDLDNDGHLDGFVDWQNGVWELDPTLMSRVSQVRIMVLGRTADRYHTVSGTPPNDIHLYRRPSLANSPGATEDDLHRRFLLVSTSNVRNKTLNLYNVGTR
jgi:prepilin-type N-terminal cleavage/methylation domain-containing protein